MSWEESHRKEQIFRKRKINREIILKAVENEDGNITLIFSLKNNESKTEVPLTIDEWNSILSFLNRTSQHILQEVKNKSILPTAEPVTEPITEPISEIEADKEISTKTSGETVSNEVFNELESEMQKVHPISDTEIPIVSSEEVIKELHKESSEESVQTQIDQPVSPSEESDLQFSAEILAETLKTEDLEVASPVVEEPTSPVVEEPTSPVVEEPISLVAEENESSIQEIKTIDSAEKYEEQKNSEIKEVAHKDLITPIPVPKVPHPTKEELKSLLTPIKQPKISLSEPSNNKSIPEIPEIPSIKTSKKESEIKMASASSQISAVDLLNESQTTDYNIPPSDFTFSIGKEDTHLSEDEKEAKIIAAMEEVATLMPPGPAKRFIEEMMLKRATAANKQRPRLPNKNNIAKNNN